MEFGVIVVYMLMKNISNLTIPCQQNIQRNIFKEASNLIFPVPIKHDTK